MRTLSFSTLLFVATCGLAAPTLGDKPPKWEYAELAFRTTPERPAGVDGDGNAVAARPATVTIRWITKEGEVDVKGWVELAERLKAIGYKKDGSAAFQKIQFLNFLGSEGWELMEQGTTGTAFPGPGAVGGAGGRGPTRGSISSGTWLLKRRVP
jgi:hypothetical protein